MLDRCEIPIQLDNEKMRRDREHRLANTRIDLPNLCGGVGGTAHHITTRSTRCLDNLISNHTMQKQQQTHHHASQQQQQTHHSQRRSPSTNANGSLLISSNNSSNNNNNNNNNNNIGSPVSSTTISSHGNSSSVERGSSTKSNSSSGSGNSGGSDIKCSTPMTPSELVKRYRNYLTDMEFEELKVYKEIWYFGQNANKSYNKMSSNQTSYDDDNGNYKIIEHDHIAFRYEILEVIGKGSFGQVIRALDHKTNTHVAIKIIRNKKRFLNQAVVELNILDELREKDVDGSHNVIHMLDYTYFRKHLCITFELMSLNLYELIKKNNYNGFSMSLIRRFCNSIVKCLRFLYREDIIHCDLKPENILLKQRGSSSIKVIDFGSSCYVTRRVYTYIQSRFYRSPEVILGLPYGTAIDMWSLGCILAELYTGFPLFPGENEVEQLACIMEILGLPPKDVLLIATRRRLFFDSRGSPRCITNSKGRKRTPGSKSLSQTLLCQDRNFLNFLQRCLEWDPLERMTPDEAAHHEFLQPSSSSRHRSCRMSNSSSTGGLNTASQKSSCYSFSEISPSSGTGPSNITSTNNNNSNHSTTGPVVASITSTTAVSNASITTAATAAAKQQQQRQSNIATAATTANNNNHNNSTGHLPDIKLSGGMQQQKMAVRSKITSSVSDLESVQQYSLHRIYGTAGGHGATANGVGASTAARKHLITSGTIATSSSKYGHGHHNTGVSGGYHSTANGLHHSHASTNGQQLNNNGNSKITSNSSKLNGTSGGGHGNNNNNMSHSQSTGDVSAIFGRA